MKKLLLSLLMILGVGLSANAQMIGATNRQQTTRVSTTTSYSSARPTGHLLRIEAGWPCSIGYGHQLNQYTMLGVGISYINGGGHSNLPLYGEVRFNTQQYPVSYFFDAKVCVNLNYPEGGDGTPFGFSGQVGILYKNFSFGLGVGFIDEGLPRYHDYYYSVTDLVYLALSMGIDIPLLRH